MNAVEHRMTTSEAIIARWNSVVWKIAIHCSVQLRISLRRTLQFQRLPSRSQLWSRRLKMRHVSANISQNGFATE